jgi:two-component system chemotaxis sensor kinase CheA
VAGRRYAIPLHAAIALLSPTAADGIAAEGRPAVWVGGDAIAVSRLSDQLGAEEPTSTDGPILVLSTPSGRHAFRVDALVGQRDVVVKDLGRVLPRIEVLAGASIEPDGSIMLVLDPSGLILQAARTGPGGADQAMSAPEQLETKRATVLVVDDALTIRELQRSILDRAGYTVAVAAGGMEALQRLSKGDVDLVLTDVEMPDMDGLELTRRIRTSPEFGQIPVVVLTSRATAEDRRSGMEAGADSYLVKSEFDEHALLTTVARLLGDPGGGP